MWTLWPTAPWCSGSSSAAGHISDKCAARPARDTDTMSIRHPSSGPVHSHSKPETLPLSLTAAAFTLRPSQECGNWTGRHHPDALVPCLVRGAVTLQIRRLSWPSWAKAARAESIHSTGGEGCWHPERQRDRESDFPLSLCLPELSLCSNMLVLLYFS